ncbi:ATP-dependent DNA ligase [Flavobacteriaceae bacterium R33]|uniref:ATP-dependent DNA ligase n=1 Tax=Poritiphilus flavus TaxID=2697053 RepID=A0A6L9EHK8_9FLAO|nr:ATP-dependent DNA ligase [Poritiphilus flavus]
MSWEKIPHSDKILFPESGITKGELATYYDAVANNMLPYLSDRPLTLHRFPNGISREGFFQKNASKYFPDWIKTAKIRKKNGWVNHVICDRKETLLYLVSQGTITFHIALSTLDKLDYPDKMIFDLDPPETNFDMVVEGAKIVRSFLENKLGLKTFVMTTGSRGLHVVVPLDRTENFNVIHDLAKGIAKHLASENPEKLTTAIRKDQRKGRLFLDYLRNSYAQTSVCPFSVRAVENAPVATTLRWGELEDKGLNAQTYNISNIFGRLREMGNPWEDFEKFTGCITEPQRILWDLGQNI